MTYLFLFLTSFISATLFPLGSEALLLYNIQNHQTILLFWTAATVGNTLGSVFNYWLGIKGEEYIENKSIISLEKQLKYRKYFKKYGGFMLLLSWVPIIGDPLTLIAGVLRYKFTHFLLLVFLAKGLRYAAVIFLANSLSV